VTATAGIYVSLPFCLSHCHYCSNPAGRFEADGAARYLARVRDDLVAAAPDWADHAVDTIYLGGGTPTLYTPRDLETLLETLTTHFRVAAGAEITTEANPETVTPDAAREWRALGLNRISIGAQSFSKTYLRALGRRHAAEAVPAAVDAARAAGFDNLSLDLIFALPGQTAAQWRDDLERAIAQEPDHLSVYGLTPEEGTTLGARVAEGRTVLPDAATYARRYRSAVRTLGRAGYGRYEVSNFARNGFACRHNLRYWEGGDYLGVGAGAASHRGGRRHLWPDDPAEYLAGAPGEAESLPPSARAVEMAIFGLRTARGIAFPEIRGRAGAPLPPAARAALGRLAAEGLVRLSGRGCRPTDRGFLFTDEIGTALALTDAA